MCYDVFNEVRKVDPKELYEKKVSLLILSSLKIRDMYGYEIMQHLKTHHTNPFMMQEGTLYPHLHRLEKEGFLKSYRKTVHDKNRQYYKLTISGLIELERQKEGWKHFLQTFHQVMGMKP